MAATNRTVTIQIELTPLGHAVMRLAKLIVIADPALIPEDVRHAARDVVAIAEEHSS